jgi:hypothetical protein
MENRTLKKMVIAMLVLIVLTPLGLLATGETFGEWGLEELKEKIGFVPQGMESQATSWNAPMPDYALPGEQSPSGAAMSYILSAIIGVGACAGLLYLFGKRIAKD